MRNSYNGNAMSIGNTRALGITATNVQCGCGREAIVDASGWLDTIEIPTLRWKDQRGFIVIAPVGAQNFVRWRPLPRASARCGHGQRRDRA
jgi:hypothetical protein